MTRLNDFSALSPHLFLNGSLGGGPSGEPSKPDRYRGDYVKKRADGVGLESTEGALQYAEDLKNFYLGQRNEVLGDTALSLLPDVNNLNFREGVDKVTVTEKGLVQALVDNSNILGFAYAENNELGDLLYTSLVSSGREVGFDANILMAGSTLEFGSIEGRDGMVRITTPDGSIYTFPLYAEWLISARDGMNGVTSEVKETPVVEEAPVEVAPVDEVPVEEAKPSALDALEALGGVEVEASPKETPVVEEPAPVVPVVEEAPVEVAPVEEAPVKEAKPSALDALEALGEVEVEASPKETPVVEEPAPVVPVVEEAPVEVAPVEEAPVEEAEPSVDVSVIQELADVEVEANPPVKEEKKPGFFKRMFGTETQEEPPAEEAPSE